MNVSILTKKGMFTYLFTQKTDPITNMQANIWLMFN